MSGILYYVDPGQGFVFAQNSSFLLAIIIGLFSAGLLFIKMFFRFLKKSFFIILILLGLVIIGGLIMHKDINKRKVIILGIDAMDPKITEQLMQERKLPNFSRLAAMGAYEHLDTTMPSESVVAWSSFSTGANPGEHGVFDFIMRDPNNYLPYLSLNEISSEKGKVKIKIRRQGETFWNILSKNKVPSFIYFCPNTFPPDKILDRMISGMGVPDITGTMGRFSFYTTKDLTDEDINSRGKVLHVFAQNNVIEAELYGPKLSSYGSLEESRIPFNIALFPNEDKVEVSLQGRRISLKEGAWSVWQNVSFKIGLFKNARGILRFYLKSIAPEFELYVTPINFDPKAPVFPISSPKGYSGALARRVGSYYTQGMPYDTWALSEDRLDEKAFLEMADEIVKEKERILNTALREFKGGAFFFYFETLDVIQHMFWRYLDPRHSLYEKGSAYQDTIFKYYEKMDKILGEILLKTGDNTTLIVLSDHGFNSFRKSVHLNRWLLENNLLFLKPGASESKGFFEDIDWSKTKAYALGFGGIYLNINGRECYGIIPESEIKGIKQEIAAGLRQLKDPETQEAVIKNVYFQEDVFRGPYMNNAPDLFVGFNEGYRASWQTALGGVPGLLLEENKKKWSGDHLIDPNLVPGVIFVNKKVKLGQPSIVDIAPTILTVFNIGKPQEMQGKVLFNGKSE